MTDVLEDNNNNNGSSCGGGRFNKLRCADGVDIICNTEDRLRERTNEVSSTANKHGTEINGQKGRSW